MKLVIEKGISIEDAMKRISNFLETQCSEYPIIKNNMSIYITLKNKEGRICPDNEKEYFLNEFGQVIDIQAEEKKRELKKHMELWNDFVKSKYYEVLKLEKQIDNDIAYLETSIEKNRTESNISKRKAQYEINKLKLEKENEQIEKIKSLENAIKENNYTSYILKLTERSAYKYSIEVMFVFENINGYTGYFDYRGLHEGLPERF